MNIWMMLFQVFNAVSAIYIYCLFFGAFSEKREFKFRNIALIGLAIIWSVVLIFMPASSMRMIIILSLIVFLSFMFRNDWYKNLLLSLLVFCLPALIEIIVGMSILLFGIDISLIDQSIYLIVGTLISKVLTFTCVQFVRIGKHKFGNISKWYYIAFGLLAICSTLISILILDYLFLNERSNMRIISIISLWLLVVTDVLIFYVIDRINKLYSSEHNLIISKQLLNEQKSHYEDIIKEQKEIAKIRHDIKNSLIGVLSQINSGNSSKAKQSLEQMYDEFNMIISPVLCKDVAINTILTVKKNVAFENSIEFICADHINNSINIDPIDLCVILGNALDNALEACNTVTNNRYIYVFIATYNTNLIISIKNSVSQKVNTENLITNKQNKKEHGFGLIKIRELAEQYNGDINLNCDDEYFEINILLSNE